METKERINLALEMAGYRRLARRGIKVRTNIKEICAHHGVSRTTGYALLAKLEGKSKEIFTPENTGPKSRGDGYTSTLLSISRETLNFLLRHASEIHKGEYATYSEKVKAGIVKQMRDAKAEHGITYEDFVEASGLNFSTVMRWNTEYDDNMKRKKLAPDLRGKKLALPSSTVRGIIEAWDKYKGRKITEFCKRYNKTHPPLSRDVITEVLIAGGRYRPRRRWDNTPAAEVKKYHPNAQWSWDGKVVKIVLGGSVYKFNLEAVVDVFSTAILSWEVTESEDEEAVSSTVREAIDMEGSPIAGLSDNGSANLSDGVTKLLEDENIEPISAYPYRPETRGGIEGLFGVLERTLGRVEINGRSEREIVRSILEAILKVCITLYNNAPRKLLDGRTPWRVLKNHPITEQEREGARESLLAQAKRSREIRETPKISKEKEWLIKRVIDKLNLSCAVPLALKVLRPYDYTAIDRADNAFYVYTQRDSFDENKRNLPYFRGIVRNIQEEIDLKRLEEYLREKYFDKGKWKVEQEELRRRREENEKKEKLLKEPEKVLLQWSRCEMNLPDGMTLSPIEQGIREAVKAVFAHKKRPHCVLGRVFDDIGCDLTYGMAKRRMAVERIKAVAQEIESELAA